MFGYEKVLENEKLLEELGNSGITTALAVFYWYVEDNSNSYCFNRISVEFQNHIEAREFAAEMHLTEADDTNYEIKIYLLNPNNHFKYVFWMGFSSFKWRVANPEAKWFAWVGGRDCDGYKWGTVAQFPTVEELADYVRGTFDFADGPTNAVGISLEQYEQYECY